MFPPEPLKKIGEVVDLLLFSTDAKLCDVFIPRVLFGLKQD